MADVLSAMEDAESESSEKISRREIACYRTKTESRFSFEKVVNVRQLRNVIFPISAMAH